MDDVIYTLRAFFCYLCGNDLYHDNFWMLLAAPRCRDHHVRNCLSSEEISLLLGCIGRESPDGKRDFAALSLAAVSGLRAGDIASLMLDDIDWKKHEIRLVQGKTSEPLIIPVPKAVLNAIADYILNGRPETPDRKVFVRHCAPFRGYHDGVSIACIFRKYQKKSSQEHVVGDGKTLNVANGELPICDIHVRCICIGMVYHSHWWPNGLDMQKWIQQGVFMQMLIQR